jgi:replication-associated recombination protein RarA
MIMKKKRRKRMSKRKVKNGKGQIDLSGNPITKEEGDTEDTSLMKSALQKYIRRGNVEKAMYWAYRLGCKSWYMVWRRLSVIAVEDSLDPLTIHAVGELYRMFWMSRKEHQDDKELNWDEKRCIVAAAKLLALAPKDRDADEFLEMMEIIEKYGEKDEEVKRKKEELEKLDEFVFDMHTKQGVQMGRGLQYWYEESSKVENASKNYLRFNEWVWKIVKRMGW